MSFVSRKSILIVGAISKGANHNCLRTYRSCFNSKFKLYYKIYYACDRYSSSYSYSQSYSSISLGKTFPTGQNNIPRSIEAAMAETEKDRRTSSLVEIFRMPKDLSGELNEKHFNRSYPAAAAVVHDPCNLQMVLKATRWDQLPDYKKVGLVRPPKVFKIEGSKSIGVPLNPLVNPNDLNTLSTQAQELVKSETIDIIPYTIELDYSFWDYDTILRTILPENIDDEIPSGFATVGHIAHLNLNEPWLPYKHTIAKAIMDKSSNIQTVVNKTEDVGLHSEFRTFPMELIGGRPDYNVTVSLMGCNLKFNFANVYYNSRLNHEHERLIQQFADGDVICDVMAGVGPFAIPAAKRQGVMVWANDLNPDSYSSLHDNVQLNKIPKGLLRPFNLDGREFIRRSAVALRKEGKQTISWPSPRISKPELARSKQYGDIFNHYVMNLPASAVEFLDAFQGVYKGDERRFTPYTNIPLPLVHVYTFNKDPEPSTAAASIVAEVSRYLGYQMKVDKAYMKTSEKNKLHKKTVETWKPTHRSETVESDGAGISSESADHERYIEDGVKVVYVRKVSPKKSMYCASFRLPAAVAFKSELTPQEKDLERRVKDWSAFREN